jgi:hypothetical protein
MRKTVSADAAVSADGHVWELSSSRVAKTVVLKNGSLVQAGFVNNRTRTHYASGESAEFFLGLNGKTIDSADGTWSLLNEKTAVLPGNAVQLTLMLSNGFIQVDKHYVVYSQTPLIREWLNIHNISRKPVTLTDPSFLNSHVSVAPLATMEFHWMTGAVNTVHPGAWTLKTETLASGTTRTFDSYDPPSYLPIGKGDGVNVRILHNNRQVWPAKGWQFVADRNVFADHDLTLDVKAGDIIRFVTNCNGDIADDQTRWDPVIIATDKTSHQAMHEFGCEQGDRNWLYQYSDTGGFKDLTFDAKARRWLLPGGSEPALHINVSEQHPGLHCDVARAYRFPQAGKVRITGSVCNIGNWIGVPGFRLGSQTYAPWHALHNPQTGGGVFIGWDYMANWISNFTPAADGSVQLSLKVGRFDMELAPTKSIETPKAFMGVFAGDLDDMGNDLLDWQYRHMWEYARKPWFPAIRMLNYWWKGTGWFTGASGTKDFDSMLRKIFRMTDLMRYVGADCYHRDFGWWGTSGDWDGPDFNVSRRYLKKHDMTQLIYASIYVADWHSKVAKEHPDWCLFHIYYPIAYILDHANPKVVDHEVKDLAKLRKRFGDFEWRNDSEPLSPDRNNHTALLAQDQGFREVMRRFLDDNPGCAFMGVNGGGFGLGYDYLRFSASFQFTDGAVGRLHNYWASLLFPPDKLTHSPEAWELSTYDKSTWMGILSANVNTYGDCQNPETLEDVRRSFDLYHFLETQGVVGRWVKLYRPLVDGDDPTMFMQRMSRDNRRGIVLIKHTVPGAITIRLKGLRPDEHYHVSSLESGLRLACDGATLMKKGLHLEKVEPGELLFLNIPNHPGSGTDKTAPTAPARVSKKTGVNMGFPGVELKWTNARDNNWISYYEVLRDGKAIDKVAKGTFYFDHSAGADPAARYEVRTVDGDENRSRKALATGKSGPRVRVINNTDKKLKYAGNWTHAGKMPLSHGQTLSTSGEPGASVELTFKGSGVTWFTTMDENSGIAEVWIDGKLDKTVNTHSGDDVWAVAVYTKRFKAPVKHTIRLVVSGKKCEDATGTLLHVDALQVRP